MDDLPAHTAPAGSGPWLKLHPWTVHRQKGIDPLLECVPAQTFLEVEEDVVRLLPELEEARDAQDAQARADTLLGPGVDLTGLIATLQGAGFLETADAAAVSKSRLASSIERAAAAVGGVLIRPGVTILGIVAILAYVLVAVLQPGLWPRAGAIFSMSADLHMSVVFSMGGLLGVAFVHELAHYAVAAAYGVRGKITADNRLYLIVLQTDVTGAWRLPRGARAKIFLAGMFFNLVMVSLGGLALGAGNRGLWPWALQNATAIHYWMALNYFPLMFQLMIYMRTDLYYLVSLLSRNRNLSGDARVFGQLALKRAGYWVMGESSEPCPACGRSMRTSEAACLRCGHLAPGVNPNMVPLQGQSMRWLRGFWIINTVGMAYMVLMLWRIPGRLFMLLARAIQEVSLDPTNVPDFLLQCVSVSLILMNIMFMGRFLFSFVGRTIARVLGLLLFLMRAYKHRSFPFVASPVLAVLDLVDLGNAAIRWLRDRLPLHRLPLFLQMRIAMRPLPAAALPL